MSTLFTTTELIQINNYDPKKCMIFSKPVNKKVAGNKQKIEYKTINISSKNKNGSNGYLLIPTSRLFSFGIKENEINGSPVGYSFPICLWNKDVASADEKKWVEKFDEIVDCCIDYLLENKEEIGMEDLVKKDLTKLKGGLNPLFWKKEVVEKKGKKSLQNNKKEGPILYLKLDFSKKSNEFFSAFVDKNTNNEINAKDLINKPCFARSAIRIDSIYIGNNISLQVKLNDALIEFLPPKLINKCFMYNPEVQVDEKIDSDED